MKKLFAISMVLLLCASALSVAAFAADTVTVYAQVPLSWDAPNVYTWMTGGEGSVGWPGTAMTQEGDWWVAQVPATDDNIIINNGSGSPQTGDTSMEAGKDVWVVVGDESNVTVSYEAPADVAPEAPETEAPETEAPETNSPATGDMGITAVSMALLAATAGLVATISKKKD